MVEMVSKGAEGFAASEGGGGGSFGSSGGHKRVSSYGYDDLIACARGELFGAGNPQLPMPPMLMFDRITQVRGECGDHNKGFIEAELDVKKAAWFFRCHFVGDAVMPGCLGLDALWQLLGFFLGWIGGTGKGRALGASGIKFSEQVLPDSGVLTYRVDIRKVLRQPIFLGIASGKMAIDGVQAYKAMELRVGLCDVSKGVSEGTRESTQSGSKKA